MPDSSVQILVFKCWFVSSSNAQPITVIILGSLIPHGLRPDKISPKIFYYFQRNVGGGCMLQLSRIYLGVIEERRPRVGSFVGDGAVSGAMEVGVLKRGRTLSILEYSDQ